MFYLTKHARYSIFISFIVTISISTSYANEQIVAPSAIPGTSKILAEDVLDLAEKFPDLLIIDARIRSDRKQGYIEGSISLPDTDMDCAALDKIIPAKNSPVIFYCNGIRCGRSVNASYTALKCDYNNIYWFRGGFEEWKAKNLPFIKL